MSNRRILVITVVTIVVGFLTLLAIGLTRQAPKTGESGVYRVNKPAIDFTLPLFTGGEITLSKLKGQPVIINFWASWCIPCRAEAKLLEDTWRSYKDKGVVFIGVDIQDKEAEAKAFIKEFNITYPNGPDNGGKITIDYGVSGIPVTFFVNRDGMIIDRFVGAISERYLITRIEEMRK